MDTGPSPFFRKFAIYLVLILRAGLYGDYIERNKWGAETGCRYFISSKNTAE